MAWKEVHSVFSLFVSPCNMFKNPVGLQVPQNVPYFAVFKRMLANSWFGRNEVSGRL
jgi:hypothetical protein